MRARMYFTSFLCFVYSSEFLRSLNPAAKSAFEGTRSLRPFFTSDRTCCRPVCVPAFESFWAQDAYISDRPPEEDFDATAVNLKWKHSIALNATSTFFFANVPFP